MLTCKHTGNDRIIVLCSLNKISTLKQPNEVNALQIVTGRNSLPA